MKKPTGVAIKNTLSKEIKNLKIKDIQWWIGWTILKIILFFQKNKRNAWRAIPVAGLSFLLAMFFSYRVYDQLNTLWKQKSQLYSLNTYDITALRINNSIKKDIKNIKWAKELIAYYDSKVDEVGRYKDYLESLKVPYDNFLQYLYLPRLNIWKDPYLETIDTELIGRNFLEKNPYDDIILLQKWSDFFKQVGQNESNQITNVLVWDIQENSDGTFTIPVSVSFLSSSKRAFLLLADKLSLTSNETNISLINEFMYYLWLEIKKTKEQELKRLTSEIVSEKEWAFWSIENQNIDKIIGYHLYQWILHDKKNELIDESLLLRTMNSLISCENEDPDYCMYEFREKYRSVPYLAYLFKWELASNPVLSFKKFLKNLPPIISVESFTFDKVTTNQLTNNGSIQYQWHVTINVFGKWISKEEVDEISVKLGTKCFNTIKNLSAEESLSLIKTTAEQTTDSTRLDSIQNNSLRELEDIMKKIEKEYPRLSNFNKIIRIFEMYRMLDESNLCEG